MQLRKQQVKNCFCLLMLSAGSPMFRMGDEFLQTQHGNNNPYNQDNETTWVDWRRLEAHPDIFRFFRLMIRFRRSHRSIARSRFWRDDIHWYGAEREVDMSAQSRALAYCLHGNALHDDDLFVMINAGSQKRRFGLHEGQPDQWHRVIDTSRESPEDIVDEPATPSQHFYEVSGHAVVVLVRKPLITPAPGKQT